MSSLRRVLLQSYPTAAAALASRPYPGRPRLYHSTRATTARSSTRVGIFIDLDNIVGEQPDASVALLPTRVSVASWIRPLNDFGQALARATSARETVMHNDEEDEDKKSKNICSIQAFANVHTQQWEHSEKRLEEQDYWEPSDDGDEEDLFPNALVQTGYDEKGILRCGVCGAKMKLTKKDIAKGRDEHDKLQKHMQSLHDREQSKRTNRLKQVKSGKRRKRMMQGKIGAQMRKYKAAQVGMGSMPRNDWFRILKEENVRCYESLNVDETLIEHAEKWLQKVSGMSRSGNSPNGPDLPPPPILVVVSRDSDFVPLLKQVQDKGGYAVSVNPTDSQQTPKLERASDLVLTTATATSSSLPLESGLLASAVSANGLFVLDRLPNPPYFGSDIVETVLDEDNLESETFSNEPNVEDFPSPWSNNAEKEEIRQVLLRALGDDRTQVHTIKQPWRLALAVHLLKRGEDWSLPLERTTLSEEALHQQLVAHEPKGKNGKHSKNQRKLVRDSFRQGRLNQLHKMVVQAVLDRGEELCADTDNMHLILRQLVTSVLQELEKGS